VEAPEKPAFSDFLLPVLTAIGAEIGVLGFVMFFGGFILWTRFEAAGLPANEAVAKVPRSDLVATGASFLVPAILAALAAAAIAVAGWDFAIGSRWRHQKERAEQDRLQATKILAGLEEEKDQLEREMGDYRSRAAQQKHLGDQASDGSTERESARGAQKAAEEEAGKCEKRLQTLNDVEIPAQRTKQREAAEKVEFRPTRRNQRDRHLQDVIGVIPMLAAGGLVILAGWGGLSDGYRALLVGVLVLTIAVSIVVVSMTDHFAWYTVCVFLSVGITIAFSTYVRTHDHAKVSPVAALSNSVPVVGFLVAETGDAVYVGKSQPAGAPDQADSLGFEAKGATMLRIPKDTVTGLTVGPIMDEDQAYRRSLRMAIALCRRSVADSGSAKPASCGANERKLLANRLEKAP
jgi:hypothetical protein